MFTIYAWKGHKITHHKSPYTEHALHAVQQLAPVSDRVVITQPSVYGQIEVQGTSVAIFGDAPVSLYNMLKDSL